MVSFKFHYLPKHGNKRVSITEYKVVSNDFLNKSIARPQAILSEMIYLSIMGNGMKIKSLSPSIAKEAGILKSAYTHVPIGDCIITATAIRNQARIISDDPHFDSIKETKRTWL